MATTVEIGVYLTAGDTPYFRLNDPVRGKLDNVSYRLAGPIFYDITDEVRSVNVKRGKNRELDRYNAGQATVSLNNQTRLFDPLNTASVFYGNIIPRRQIRIRSGGYNQFVGVIEDWNLDYDVSGQSLASITAADGFTLLAQQTLTPGTATAQKTGARVEAVLSQPSVAWPLADRIIDTGNSDLGADVFDGNVLSYLQKVEASEQGQFFINRDGYIRFINGAVTPTSGSMELVATNLVTNPSMEASSGMVTVRTNLVTNPSFEVDLTSWGNGGSTSVLSRITSDFYLGTASMQVACTTSGVAITSTRPAVSASTTYTASVWVKATTGTIVRIELGEWTSGGVIVGSRTLGVNTTATGSWQRLSATRAMGATGATADIVIRNVNSVANTILVDAVLLEASATVGDYFDGSFQPAGDFSYGWTGTAHASTSLMRGVGVANANSFSAASVQSSHWSSSGNKSVRTIPNATSNVSVTYPYGTGMTVFEAGKTYTVSVTCRLDAPLTGSLWTSDSRRLVMQHRIGAGSYTFVRSDAAPNAAGSTRLSITFTLPAGTTAAFLYMANGASAGNGDVWWDDLIVVEGTYTGDYFDGSTTSSIPYSYRWTGTENASTSVKELSTLPLFSDAGDGIPYVGASVQYGTELLYNQVEVTYPAGTATATNAESQTKYGISATSVDTLLGTGSSADSLADYWVARYGEPDYRFDSIDVALDGLSGPDAETVLQFELGDIVQMKFTPNNVGSPIERYLQITSIDHSVSIAEHRIRFGVSSLQFAFLVLDDTGFGILDENALAF